MPLVKLFDDDNLILDQVVHIIWDIAIKKKLMGNPQNGPGKEFRQWVTLLCFEDFQEIVDFLGYDCLINFAGLR